MAKNILSRLLNANIEPYRPVVFWSINSELCEDELRRQINEMKALRLGGFIFHARAGLTTEYLSDEWFSLVGACLDEAARLDMKVWLYDEFGWPSGFVAGRLLEKEDYRARYLEYAVLDFFDRDAYAVYDISADGVARRLREGESAEKYHTLYMRYSDAYVDILNPEVTDAFISATHEEYYKRFSARFGKELVGFFTDEPQYYRYATPLSKVTEEEYAREYGENMRDGLIYLFTDSEHGYPFRCNYYNLMSRLYCENFYGKLNDWCDGHGCLLTGHSVEETFFFTQMWGGADCAISYLYEHVPAIDNLAQCSSAVISAKSVGSVAAQSGKKFVMTETFGCSGYGVTPAKLKLIGDKQYVHGVNLMCQHLYNYSLAGQGKIDHPVSFGRTLSWLPFYPDFNEYFARLGYLIGKSEEQAPVAVITPMESVYLDYKRLDEEKAKKHDASFMKSLDILRGNGVAYHLVNEKVLSKLGSVRGGCLKVSNATYEAVVLADCLTLKPSTVKLLREVLRGGGKLLTLGDKPKFIGGKKSDLTDLKDTVKAVDLPRPIELKTDKTIDYTYRTLGGKAFVFAVNEHDEAVKFSSRDELCEVDIMGETGYAPKREFIIPPESSVLLEVGGYDEPEFAPIAAEEIVPQFDRADENCLTIENVAVTLESGEKLSGYVYGVFETLVKRGYCGKITAEFSFESDAECEVLLSVEKMPVSDARFNGEPVAFERDWSDANFALARVKTKRGRNEYTYDAEFAHTESIKKVLYDSNVPESLRNCFSYCTLLEPIYIIGDFSACGGAISASDKKVSAGNLTEAGFENFCGSVTYSFTLYTDVNRVRLEPIGDFSACEFSCGISHAYVMLEKSAILKLPYRGKNLINVKVYSTMRNKFGPFHNKSCGEDAISPDSFLLRGKWTDERTNPDYTPERNLIPFGLSKVRVEYGK